MAQILGVIQAGLGRIDTSALGLVESHNHLDTRIWSEDDMQDALQGQEICAAPLPLAMCWAS